MTDKYSCREFCRQVDDFSKSLRPRGTQKFGVRAGIRCSLTQEQNSSPDPINNVGGFSIGSLVVSFLGAIILLAIVNFFRKRA